MTITVDRYRPEDRAAVEALFRRMHGDAAAEPFLERWQWQYERNPNLPNGLPLIWLLRDDDEVIGEYATMPVRLTVHGKEIDAAWGMDVMITPEHQRKGYGRLLFDAWDRGVGAAIGVGLTDASHGLFTKLRWPDMGRVPRLLKPFSARATTQVTTKGVGRALAHATRPFRNLIARYRPLGGQVREIVRFDDSLTRLWDRVSPKFAFAVRRDAPYLNWRFAEAAHVKYTIATLVRGSETLGYVVIRHVEQQGLRVTILVDFLGDPREPESLVPLLRWVDRQALEAGSDLVRVFATHLVFRTLLGQLGYVAGPPGMRFVAKVNAVGVPAAYYESFAAWHVTVGDSDSDR
jgi:GNAT superfamily N-acetyltransferase